MPNLYLRVFDRVLIPALLVLALVLLLRGHNEPGGGFIAGLVVAAAVQLQVLSNGEAGIRRRLGPLLHPLTGLGLVVAAGSAVMGLAGGPLFTGLWADLELGPFKLSVGTPQLFDIGVFLVVFSVVSSYLLGLSRGNEDISVDAEGLVTTSADEPWDDGEAIETDLGVDGDRSANGERPESEHPDLEHLDGERKGRS